jgi:hypothetical protein
VQIPLKDRCPDQIECRFSVKRGGDAAEAAPHTALKGGAALKIAGRGGIAFGIDRDSYTAFGAAERYAGNGGDNLGRLRFLDHGARR